MDRRTLLKAVPAAFVAGVVGAAVVAAPETASARATPKAAPAGSKVVVLGGNGFVGSKVCEMLVEAGEREGSFSGVREACFENTEEPWLHDSIDRCGV